MRRTALARWSAACIIALIGSGVLAAPAHADSRVERDAAQVYCVAPTQRAQLVDAAVVLGLATRGGGPDRLTVKSRDLTLEEWRRQHRRDFDRACAALRAAAQTAEAPPASPGPGPVLTMLSVLLPVIAGALLAWLAGEWRDVRVRRRALTDDLRAAIRDFAGVVESYVHRQSDDRRPGTPPDDQPVRDRRAALAAQLHRVAAEHRRWVEPENLRRALVGDLLGDDLAEEWAGKDDDARRRRAAAVRASLQRFTGEAHHLADLLGRPRPAVPWRRAKAAS